MVFFPVLGVCPCVCLERHSARTDPGPNNPVKGQNEGRDPLITLEPVSH